ncbi:hypothetical protein KNP414_05309 [Paenibacillus mucilaginosus KNP414]|uniref:Uncharacterized protein n=1 Tax=Paenibacillus mucilaginosus (strain KNP414) TaxID=1036673 RepID=F8FE74_PAEMK|nr:hypothetical protein KNP414_05309 [Paenibacillus mucilaginosus KNP414]
MLFSPTDVIIHPWMSSRTGTPFSLSAYNALKRSIPGGIILFFA